MATVVRDQLALDEKVLDIPELEEALEDRQEAKAKVSDARSEYDRYNEKANAEIEKLELPADGAAVRVGRFRVTRSFVSARSVSFEAKATTRVRISLVDAE